VRTGSDTWDENRDAIEALKQKLGESEIGKIAIDSLIEIHRTLISLGIGPDCWRFDKSIVRGLEYYTGAVFEAELLIEAKDEKGNTIRFGSVGGGGRYDDLVSRFRGEAIPATGFSVGVSRLLAALEAIGQGAAEPFGPVVVLAMDKAATAEYFAMAAELRNAGVAAEVYLGSAGMKAQLKYADKRRAPVAVIVGGDELAAGTITAKNLILGDRMSALAGDDRDAYNKLRAQVQVTAPRAELAATVKALIADARKLAGDAS
jgi:histidyl-tRNA synthetase